MSERHWRWDDGRYFADLAAITEAVDWRRGGRRQELAERAALASDRRRRKGGAA